MSEGADETPIAGISAELQPDGVGTPDRAGVDTGSGDQRVMRRWVAAGLVLVASTAIAAVVVATGDPGPLVQSTDVAPIRTSTSAPLVTVGVVDQTTVIEPVDTTARIDATSSTVPTVVSTTSSTSIVPAVTAPPQDAANPAVVARPVPVDPPPLPPSAPPPPWADSTFTTSAGLLSTNVGCAEGTSAAALDRFFADRVGPVLGWDYQHVVSLGATRSLWLFQDAFIDHSGTAESLGKASFAHNVALLEQDGCFTLLHNGSATRPTPFEPGTGTTTLSTWFWPMGGEMHDGELHIVWVKMTKDRVDPKPPNGLGWHPTETFIATYDPATLARRDFRRAPNAGVAPIYGYAMASDATHTYLFGNTFEQNLSREGGYWNGPHSATQVFLARVSRGRVFDRPEYRTSTGWSTDPALAVPILSRHWAEFPFQPRYIDGQWVGVAAVDGYWDEKYSVDVANVPWGPWTTIESRAIAPRNADPKMNTYHAHLLPTRDATGQLVVTISNNARNMLRDAWPRPDRYRPVVFTSPWVVPPADPLPTTTTTSTSTTTIKPTTTTSTTVKPSTTTSTSTTIKPTTTITPTSTISPTSTTSTSTTSTSTTSTTTVAPTSSTVASTAPGPG